MENAIPQHNFYQSIKDLKTPTIEKIETEEAVIASLAGSVGWEALKGKLERRINNLEQFTKVTEETAGLVQDMQQYGFMCFAKDLIVEAYGNIIREVELAAQVAADRRSDTPPSDTDSGEGE